MKKKIKKVSLVIPPLYIDSSSDYIRFLHSQGLPLISSNISKNIELDFIDSTLEGFNLREPIPGGMLRVGISYKELEKRFANSDLVGISCNFTTQLPAAVNVAKISKKMEIPSILGGVHPTFDWRNIIKEKLPFDYIAIGEGVSSFNNIIDYLEKGSPLENIVNYFDPPMDIPKAIPQLNLKKINPPDYSLYESSKEARKKVVEGTSLEHLMPMGTIFSIGCPFRCDFCSTVQMATRYQSFSKNQIIEQINQIKSLGYNYLIILDDNLLTDQKMSKWIFKQINEADLKVIYDGGIYINFCSEELIDAMSPSVERVFIALERKEGYSIDKFRKINSSQEELDKKRIKILESFKKRGIATSGYLTIGYPKENLQSIMKTLEYGNNLKQEGLLDYASINIITAYPGTPLWDSCKQKNLLISPKALTPQEYRIYSTSFGNIDHPSVSRARIRDLLLEYRERINGKEYNTIEKLTGERIQLKK